MVASSVFRPSEAAFIFFSTADKILLAILHLARD
jgi:hypothetical protein